MQKIIFPASVIAGLLIAYMDSRPNWDDTGVTAGAVFLCCALFGVLGPTRPWLWALCVGLWIPVYAITSAGNYGAILALIIAFAGAYAGMAFRRLLSGQLNDDSLHL